MKNKDKVISRIPLTGGPKAGKTVIEEAVKEHVEDKYGLKVFFVPETATEFIRGGCIPLSRPDENDKKQMREFIKQIRKFQYIIWDLQRTKERDYDIFANAQPRESVIIYDRATIDNWGYLLMHLGDDKTFQRMIARRGYTIRRLYSKYDGVISLQTSAGIINFNERLANDGTFRLEANGDEAAIVDYFVSKAWEGHPNYHRIEATEKPEDKTAAALAAVDSIIEGSIEKRKEKKLILPHKFI